MLDVRTSHLEFHSGAAASNTGEFYVPLKLMTNVIVGGILVLVPLLPASIFLAVMPLATFTSKMDMSQLQQNTKTSLTSFYERRSFLVLLIILN